VIPIPKKANAVECAQLRTISLIPHMSKIVLNIIKKRMDAQIEERISDTQYGFRQKMGTRDAIGTLRFMSERMLEQNKALYLNIYI